ncbi:MAG: hypothetical protein AB8G11_16050 [Saprospiraceae bacterium]
MYGEALGRHLYGWDGTAYTDSSLYASVGMYMLIISLILAIGFYLILNSPRFSRWYHWLIILGVNFIINWGIGYYLPFIDYDTGMIATDIEGYISTNEIVMFGLVNAIWSILFFIGCSILCRLIAKFVPGVGHNTQDTPFPK